MEERAAKRLRFSPIKQAFFVLPAVANDKFYRSNIAEWEENR